MFEIKKPIYLYDMANTTKYVMTKGEVDILIQKLNSESGPYTDIILNKLNSDVAQYIYSVREYPFDILDKVAYDDNGQTYYSGIISGSTGTGNLKNPNLTTAKMMKQITIGDRTATPETETVGNTTTIKPDGKVDGFDVVLMGAVMDDYNALIELGKIYIEPKYNNYLDLAPYTSIEVYLPYAGIVNLDPNEVMGKTIHIQYVVDFGTGNATSYITTWDVDQDVLLLDTRSFNIAIDLPITSNNAAEMQRNQILQGMNIGQGIAGNAVSGNWIDLPVNAVKGLSSAIFSSVPKFNKGIEPGGYSSTYAEQKVQVFITRPDALYYGDMVEEEQYNFLHGRPSSVNNVSLQTLINAGAYFRCGDMHLEGFTTASKKELDEIESLLKSGVIG